MNKCTGCGKKLEDGKTLCERCFRIINYNEYKVVSKSNTDFIPILENINKTNDLVLLVVDLFNIPDLSIIRKYINNDIILVLTKRDILPKKMFEEKLLDYDYKIDYVDKIIISSKKNYQFDELLDMIEHYKKGKNVYVVGFTNAGKSTMINSLLHNYSKNEVKITTSPLPSTTLDLIEIELDNDLTLIDTPGLLIEGDLVNYLSGEELKKVIPRKEIRPITYQIKGHQFITIDKYLKIEATDIDLTFYVSNDLEINRYYKDNSILSNLEEHIIDVNRNDVVIRGLGFIKTTKRSKLTIYSPTGVDVFTRDSLI